MAGSMRTFVTDGRTDWLTDGADYIGPERVQKVDEKNPRFSDTIFYIRV